MASQDYAGVALFYNNAPVKQLSRVRRMLNANNQPIVVLGDGLSGFSDGTGECTIEWDAPIPIGGTEFDYEGDCHAKAYVDLQVFVGRRSYSGRGKIQTAETEQSAGAPSSISVSWQGEFKRTA